MDDERPQPVVVVVTPQCRAYMVTFRDGQRGLVINYGGPDLEFRVDDPQVAEMFALSLVKVAIDFAEWCYNLPGGRRG